MVFPNELLLTNESSSVGPNGLLLIVNDKLEFSIDSLVNWIVLEETTFTSFSLNNSPLWTTRLNTHSKFWPLWIFRSQPEWLCLEFRQGTPQIFRIINDMETYHLVVIQHLWCSLDIQSHTYPSVEMWSGNDLIETESGDDGVYGGSGNDRIGRGEGRDDIFGDIIDDPKIPVTCAERFGSDSISGGVEMFNFIAALEP